MTLRPYISLDLETTGLDTDRSEILELGAVLDDGICTIDSLQAINHIINLKEIEYAEPKAIQMNARLFQAMVDHRGVSVEVAFTDLIRLFKEASVKAMAWDANNGQKPRQWVTIAGKNAAVFDVPLMRSFLRRHSFELKQLFQYIHFMVLDVGSLYYADFGRIPSLTEISALLGREKVAHKAAEDALDVVYAVRAKFKTPVWATLGDKFNGN